MSHSPRVLREDLTSLQRGNKVTQNRRKPLQDSYVLRNTPKTNSLSNTLGLSHGVSGGLCAGKVAKLSGPTTNPRATFEYDGL